MEHSESISSPCSSRFCSFLIPFAGSDTAGDGDVAASHARAEAGAAPREGQPEQSGDPSADTMGADMKAHEADARNKREKTIVFINSKVSRWKTSVLALFLSPLHYPMASLMAAWSSGDSPGIVAD